MGRFTTFVLIFANIALVIGSVLYYHLAISNRNDTLRSLEVVIAHYDEDLSWINNKHQNKQAKVKYTIYSKNPNKQANGSIPIANVGRESQTFLYHIVTNYDNLADWTVFTQASAPGFGFRPNDHESGHMCSGVTWYDYLEPNVDGWYEVQTVATRYPEMWHSDRVDMMFQVPTSQGDTCPTDFKGQKGWSNWWMEENHPLLKKQSTDTDFVPPVEFYNRLVVAAASNKYYDHFTLNYANGGRFAVSRDRIHSRPISYYKDLLYELSKNINPIEGYYMETMWFDVFHPEKIQAEFGSVCDVPAFSDEGVSNHAIMYAEALTAYEETLLDIYGSLSAIPRNLMKSSPYYIELPEPSTTPSMKPVHFPNRKDPQRTKNKQKKGDQ